MPATPALARPDAAPKRSGQAIAVAGRLPSDVVDALVSLAHGHPIDTRVAEAAARGWSANTTRAFLADLRAWRGWCRGNGVLSEQADAESVAAWVRVLGQGSASERRAPATIARYLVHLGIAYRMAGLADPTAAPLVKLEVKALRRARGVGQRQARALRYKGVVDDLSEAPSGVCLANLLLACKRDWQGLRDALLLRLAYDSGARASELVAIEVADIEGPFADGSGLLTLKRSKTDQDGQGANAYLSAPTMTAITRWRKAIDLRAGPLLRRVTTHFDGSVRSVEPGALHVNSVTLIYRRLIVRAWEQGHLGEMSPAERDDWLKAVSSHSVRVGVAQDNFAAGEDLPAIMQAYRWRDAKTVLRYGAKLAARSGAAARMAKRVGP